MGSVPLSPLTGLRVWKSRRVNPPAVLQGELRDLKGQTSLQPQVDMRTAKQEKLLLSRGDISVEKKGRGHRHS